MAHRSPDLASLILLFVTVMVPPAAWISLRRYRRRLTDRALAGARAEQLVDDDFRDALVLEVVRDDLRAIEGEHPIHEVAAVGELLGTKAADWILQQSAATAGPSQYSLSTTACDVIRVLDRGEEGTKRIVVRVEVRIAAEQPLYMARRSFYAFWTYAEHGARWTRWAIEDEWTGRRHLKHDARETPEADNARLHDRAVLEQAAPDSAAATVAAPADVIGYENAERAALDLATVDQRYAHDVIESCVHRILAAWEQATNGAPAALNGLASSEAAHQLLHPAKGQPAIVREPELKRLKLVEVDTRSAVPTLTTLISIRAEPDIRQYDAYWRLAPSSDGHQPWILADAHAWKNAYLFHSS